MGNLCKGFPGVQARTHSRPKTRELYTEAPTQDEMDDLTPEQYEAAKKIANLLVNKTARRRRISKLMSTFDLASALSLKGTDSTEKLMDQKYWIEAADKQHRYGSLLVPYYKEWLASGSSEGFFTWLDEGDGKDLDLEESPRDKLVTSAVEYLDDAGREACQVIFAEDDDTGEMLMVYKATGEVVDTPVRCCMPLYRIGVSSKYIFVCDLDYNLYVHQKKTGFFHHSSFLNGRPARAAGGVVVEDGILLVVNGNSGHYKPSPRMLEDVWGYMEETYGLDPDSYLMVYPRTRRICPAFCKCVPTVPANFPC